MNSKYSSWLKNFFKERTKAEEKEKNIIQGEKIALGGDGQIWHIVCDILKDYPANAVMGLLPRNIVDYNRFIKEVAYADKKVSTFYDFYHKSIERIIKKLLLKHKKVILLDLHGFGTQPIVENTFDIILGTNDKETSPDKIDEFFYSSLKNNYKIFCNGVDNMPPETLYKGDTSNLYYYKKFGINTMLIEIASKFRSGKISSSKENGKQLAKDIARFLKQLENKLKQI